MSYNKTPFRQPILVVRNNIRQPNKIIVYLTFKLTAFGLKHSYVIMHVYKPKPVTCEK